MLLEFAMKVLSANMFICLQAPVHLYNETKLHARFFFEGRCHMHQGTYGGWTHLVEQQPFDIFWKSVAWNSLRISIAGVPLHFFGGGLLLLVNASGVANERLLWAFPFFDEKHVIHAIRYII